MAIKDYCKMMDVELTSWKAKLYDVISKIDRLPTEDKKGVTEDVKALHYIMSELDEKIETLRSECPVEWKPEKEKIASQLAELCKKYNRTTKELFGYDFG
nr:hypothetical protein [Desulfobulbaceae bacterium]